MKKMIFLLLLLPYWLWGQTFTGTIDDVRMLTGTAYETIFTTDYGGGTWNYDSSDLTSIDNIGTILVDSAGHRYKRVYSGFVNVLWFGAKGNGVADDTEAFQKAIDYCVTNRARPKTLWIPVSKDVYKLTEDLVINVRDSSVWYNPAKFSIIGEQGKGNTPAADVGVSLFRTGSGRSIIRICEDVDGSFPYGGDDSVTYPLNFLRSVVIKGINFVGTGTDTARSVNGISGRSIDNSVIENCGFVDLNFAIKLGTGEENVPNKKNWQGVDLDYCERNRIQENSFDGCKKMIYITSPDITTITGNFFHSFADTSGTNYAVYWAAGNDYLTVSKNILHPRTKGSPSYPIKNAFRCYATRGARFYENHLEGIGDSTFNFKNVEHIDITNNLIYGVVPVSNVISLTGKEYGRINVQDNMVALPSITGNFLNVAAIADATGAKLKTINTSYKINKATTTLGGATPLELTSNLDSRFSEYGQAYNPYIIGRNYLYSDSLGNLRTKTLASGKPTSNTSGKILSTASDLQGVTEGGKTTNIGIELANAPITRTVPGSGSTNQRFIGFPKGAAYAGTASETGALVFKHSTPGQSFFLNAVIGLQMYNSSYTNTTSRGSVEIGLTCNSIVDSFNMLSSYINGNTTLFNGKVRVARDPSGNMAIIIGDTNTNWSSAYVRGWIEQLRVGFIGGTASFDTGWNTSLVTSLSGYNYITDLNPRILASKSDLLTKADTNLVYTKSVSDLRYTQKLIATATIDFSSVTANSIGAGTTVTVTGALTTDQVLVTPSLSPTDSIIYNALVTSSNTVTIFPVNISNTDKDPPSTNFQVMVIR